MSSDLPLIEIPVISDHRDGKSYLPSVNYPAIPIQYQQHFLPSSDENRWLMETADAIASGLIFEGDISVANRSIWEMSGYHPDWITQSAPSQFSNSDYGMAVEANERIQKIEFYLGLPLTGNLDTLKFNFERKYITPNCLNFQSVESCWLPAIQTNQINIVQSINHHQSQRNQLSRVVISDSIQMAAGYGYCRMVGILLNIWSQQGGLILPDSIQGKDGAIFIAANLGYRHLVELLANYSSSTERARAREEAYYHGYTPIVKILWDDTISTQTILTQIGFAINQGNAPMFEFLWTQFLNRNKPSSINLQHWYEKAAANGTPKLFQSLTAAVPTALTPVQLSEALLPKAIQMENLPMIQYFLDLVIANQAKIDPIQLVKLCFVQGFNKTKILLKSLRTLLQNGLDPNIAMTELIQSTDILTSNLQAGLDLIRSYPIDLEQHFLATAQGHRRSLLQELIPSISDPETFNRAIRVASDSDIIKILLPVVTSEAAINSTLLNLMNSKLIVESKAIQQILDRVSDPEVINAALSLTDDPKRIGLLLPRVTSTGEILAALDRVALGPWNTPSVERILIAVLNRVPSAVIPDATAKSIFERRDPELTHALLQHPLSSAALEIGFNTMVQLREFDLATSILLAITDSSMINHLIQTYPAAINFLVSRSGDLRAHISRYR